MSDTGNIMLTLADKRKALIVEMEAQGLSPLQIYERLEIPTFGTAGRRLEANIAHCEMVADALKWYELEGILLDDEVSVFYFDWDEGVCERTACTLLFFGSGYTGQRFVTEPEDVIPVILHPLMTAAIEERNIRHIEKLTDAVRFMLARVC